MRAPIAARVPTAAVPTAAPREQWCGAECSGGRYPHGHAEQQEEQHNGIWCGPSVALTVCGPQKLVVGHLCCIYTKLSSAAPQDITINNSYPYMILQSSLDALCNVLCRDL